MAEARQGIAAFTLGFGVFFFLMILFTLWYARWLLPGQWDRLPRVLAWIIAAHICVQSAFTIALHARPLLAPDSGIAPRASAIVLSIVALFLPTLWPLDSASSAVRGEQIYRLFLGFYGLVFPAYVLIFMWPLRDVGSALRTASPNADGKSLRSADPTKRSVSKAIALVIALLASGPLFYLGFIENRMVWLIPGLLIVLLAKFIVDYIPAGSPSERS